MRIFAALITACALASAPAVSYPQEPVRPIPIVVIVHGRGHMDGDSAALRRQWKRAVDDALASASAPSVDLDVRLAWYADILDPSGLDACQRAAEDSLGIGALTSFVGALTELLPRNQESREARGLIGDLLWVVDDARRCAAERRVGAVIERAMSEQRPVIVIGYSLGSVVTYGYLSARNPRANDPALHLITIGSPLGNPVVRELLGQRTDSLRKPLSVRSWENVYDPNDPFAARIADAAVPQTAADHITENDTRRDPHDIERYLGDRATAEALTRLLCGMNRTPPACRR